mmetsp:Transcript_10420/g.42027  ORF Transcript_10420/g.42027 Transcript_10420/m.42027 type:complete len:278 (-) Transcript_10420:169-1002(-)
MDAGANGRRGRRRRQGVHRLPGMRRDGGHRGWRMGVPIRRQPRGAHPDRRQGRPRDGVARELQAGRAASRHVQAPRGVHHPRGAHHRGRARGARPAHGELARLGARAVYAHGHIRQRMGGAQLCGVRHRSSAQARGRLARHGQQPEPRQPGRAERQLESVPDRHEVCRPVHGGFAHRHVAGWRGGGRSAVRGGGAVRGVREPPSPAARVRPVHRRAHPAALPHEPGLCRLGQVGAGDRARLDGDGESGARRGSEAGDGAAGQDAAGRAGVGAPGGVR